MTIIRSVRHLAVCVAAVVTSIAIGGCAKRYALVTDEAVTVVAHERVGWSTPERWSVIEPSKVERDGTISYEFRLPRPEASKAGRAFVIREDQVAMIWYLPKSASIGTLTPDGWRASETAATKRIEIRDEHFQPRPATLDDVQLGRIREGMTLDHIYWVDGRMGFDVIARESSWLGPVEVLEASSLQRLGYTTYLRMRGGRLESWTEYKNLY